MLPEGYHPHSKKMNIDKQNNDLMDKLLQQRQDAAYSYAKATKQLLEMGVKVTLASTGEMALPASYNEHLHKYNRSNLEFEWVAHYDGSRPDTFQFDELGHESHFGNIDQAKLKLVSLISNFNWPTDNTEKRIIVTLNLETGLFDFMNGFVPQDVRGALMDPVAGPKKLILFRKRRQSDMAGELSEELREFHPPTDEICFYNRFILGFETENGIKRTVLIQPNGLINLWEIK